VAPYRRASNPWIFFIILSLYALLKRTAFTTTAISHLGVAGEAFVLLALFQGVLHASSAIGVFEARYAIKIFDDRQDMNMITASILATVVSVAGVMISVLAATARTYKIVLVPRDDIPSGGFELLAARFMHSWNTICLALFVVLIVRPDAIKKMIR